MEEQRFKSLYQWMVQKGEINDFLPKSTGEWEKDRVKFIHYQTEMEKLANLTEFDLE